MTVDVITPRVARPELNAARDPSRTNWIDICKGLGISSIVLGHSLTPGFTTRFVFLFHVPLFFFLSGYLHKPQPNLLSYLKKKTFHLVLPYLAFLAVYAGIQSIKIDRTHASFLTAGEDWLWGGTHLIGFFSIFWFITCLFLTQQLMNWLIVTLKPRALVLTVSAFLCASYLNATVVPFTLPLDANVVLAACPFFLAGYACRRFVLPPRTERCAERWTERRAKRWAAAVSIALVAASIILIRLGVAVSYDMKYAGYGIPFLSFVLSLGCIYSIVLLSQTLQSIPLAMKPLAALGTASMGIMYLHPLALNRIFAWKINDWAGFAITLTVSWLVTKLLASWSPTRIVFLGTR